MPAGSESAYQTADYWESFTNILPIADDVSGDVNGDGNVNISDVTTLIDLLLSGATAGNSAADFNNDGHVSISDVTDLISYLLSH